MARILVVDDQAELAELIQTVLEEDGHAVEVVASGQGALDRLGEAAYELVVCDLQMPDVDGVAVYRAVERLAPPRPAVLLMTGYAEGSAYADFLQATHSGRAIQAGRDRRVAWARSVGTRGALRMETRWTVTCRCGWLASAETYERVVKLASEHEAENAGTTGHLTTISDNRGRRKPAS